MRILHCCLSCFYNEGYNYQENMLPKQNKKDGHEVLVLASTETFVDNVTYGYVEPQTYVNEDGIRVIRVPYRKIFTDAVSHKIRAYQGVYSIIEKFAPDVIMFHGIGAWELLTIVEYVKKNKIKLFIDTHASAENSGRNWVSLNILHKLFYKPIIKRALPYAEKILCVGFEEYAFAKKVYGISEEMLELWPLGGIVPENEEYEQRRQKCRKELGISEDRIVFLHSGKMVRGKKTCELVKAFHEIPDDRFCMLIAGSLGSDIEVEALRLFEEEPRVNYLRWKSGDELLDLLCATDVYMQPGTVSATMQNALCCRCAVMVYPYEVYQWILQDRGYYAETSEDIREVLREISSDRLKMVEKRELCFDRAKEILDYKVIAARLYE